MRKGLFSDRLNFNLISDMPGTFLDKLEALEVARAAQGPAVEAAAAAANSEMLAWAESAGDAGPDGLETPRAAPTPGMFSEDANTGKRESKNGETILTGTACCPCAALVDC